MWAHYGGNNTGFVLEIDEASLADHFEAGFFEDVEYKSEIGFCDLEVIRYAATTCKPRHVHRARSLAFRSAYFTKSDCWAYEQERRLVLDGSHFDEDEKLMIREFPASCVTAIISGCRTRKEDLESLREAAIRFGCPNLHLRLGKSISQPYFVGRQTAPEVFDGHEITPADFSCGSCGDPIEEERLSCPWCDMTEEDATEAALNDPMRLYAIAGMPNPYGLSFAGIRAVGTRTKPNTEQIVDPNA